MYSLDPELEVLRAERGTAAAPRTPFSVAPELRAALYGGVTLILSGTGILLGKHLAQIGPLTLTLLIALAAAACYLPALRAQRAASARSNAADYLLLLGALLLSADLGYAESQWHLLGEHWSWYLPLLAIVHAVCAYRFDSRPVLGVALASLAGWFGIAGVGLAGPLALLTEGWHLGTRALACAATLLTWRALEQRFHGGRFASVLLHAATNLAFWASLSWCLDEGRWPLGLIATLAFAALCIRRALLSRAELFAVYGIGYAALAVMFVIARLTHMSTAGVFWVLLVVLSAAAALKHLHAHLKERAT